ncbi:hypothetical protein KYK14_08785 [Hymenobacter profundi]|uniref:Uncharacterized protein n=1 Tax=Hymenobacter profundi TaxID=1982110 RepID=A0ABS6WYG4_9BACT|nr:hypothetical protein [Hymenobacter profundi]
MRFTHLPTPAVALTRWQETLDTLQANAFYDPSELVAALEQVREPIATFLVAEDLLALPEHAFFVEQMAALDAAFRDFTVDYPAQSGPRRDFRWWCDRVPKRWVNEHGEYS